MHPTDPRFMSDEERINAALDLLNEAFSALCYVGTGPTALVVGGIVRPARVEKAINRIDKTMIALEKELGQ